MKAQGVLQYYLLAARLKSELCEDGWEIAAIFIDIPKY